MKDYEFYRKYANLPLGERFKIVDVSELGLMTASEIYQEIHTIDDRIRPDIIRKEKLIRAFENYLLTLTK